MKITRKQLKQLIKEEIQKLDEVTTAMKIAAQRTGRPHPGSSPPPPGHPWRSDPHKSYQPDYGVGNLTIEDVKELFPNLSADDQNKIWDEHKGLNNIGELKAATLGL